LVILGRLLDEPFGSRRARRLTARNNLPGGLVLIADFDSEMKVWGWREDERLRDSAVPCKFWMLTFPFLQRERSDGCSLEPASSNKHVFWLERSPEIHNGEIDVVGVIIVIADSAFVFALPYNDGTILTCL
jgi:hypothetical protein